VTPEFAADSKHEAAWSTRLLAWQQAGVISGLKLDKAALLFALDVNGYRICQYEADARFDVVKPLSIQTLDGFEELEVGRHVVLDAKSPPTRKRPAYVMKRKLMVAIHGVKIMEV
jgi:hypothetical protein